MVTCPTTMTSWWARWRLKSPASRLISRPFLQAQIKKTSNLHVIGICEGNSSGTGRKCFHLMTSSCNSLFVTKVCGQKHPVRCEVVGCINYIPYNNYFQANNHLFFVCFIFSPTSPVAIATREVQVSAADSQTVIANIQRRITCVQKGQITIGHPIA